MNKINDTTDGYLDDKLSFLAKLCFDDVFGKGLWNEMPTWSKSNFHTFPRHTMICNIFCSFQYTIGVQFKYYKGHGLLVSILIEEGLKRELGGEFNWTWNQTILLIYGMW